VKGIVERILEGKFEYETGKLEFSKSKVEISLYPGESYEGSFVVKGPEGKLIQGEVRSSNAKMECVTETFSGNGNEIGFIFHGDGLVEGDVVKGYFYIVSNCGEYAIPFVVMVSFATIESSIGTVKNLFHFANLAKSNWKEAVELFYSKPFLPFLEKNEQEYVELYRGLSKYDMQEANVEEFLIAIHKKDANTYIIDEDVLEIEPRNPDDRYELLVTRNGWGYTRVQVETDGSFIKLEKTVLTEEDFLGNRCNLYYYIDLSKLHYGKNHAKIRLYNAFVSTEVEIVASLSVVTANHSENSYQWHCLTAELTKAYVAFRAKQIKKDEFKKAGIEILESMGRLRPDYPIPQLMASQLLLTEERNNEAVWNIDHARSKLMQSKDSDPALWYYYMYLTTLIRSEESNYVRNVTEEIRATYNRYPQNWRLAWILLFMEEELNRSASARWLFLKEQFDHSCRSPIILVEAWLMVRSDASLLMELGDFEMQILQFASRRGLLTSEIVAQLHYLTSRREVPSARLLQVLQKAYEIQPDETTLSSICTLLIREKRKDAEAAAWYECAIQAELRVPKLYEYYIYSQDLSSLRELPYMVYMYFSYHNTLEPKYTAYLYANLVAEAEKYQELFEQLLPTMQRFLVDMIKKGKTGWTLAYLFSALWDDNMLDAECEAALSRLLFTWEVHTDNPRHKNVVVIHKHLEKEQVYGIYEGKALIEIYHPDVCLFWEEEEGNRIAFAKEEEAYQLYAAPELLKRMSDLDKENVHLQLAECFKGHAVVNIQKDNLERFRTLLAAEEIDTETKREIVMQLLDYYGQHGMEADAAKLLSGLDLENVGVQQKADFVKYLVQSGEFQSAKRLYQQIGTWHIEPLTLAKLSVGLIEEMPVRGLDQDVLRIAEAAFEENQFEEVSLQYLLDYYECTTKKMRDVWKRGVDYHLDLSSMDERILMQMLYTGYFVGEKMAIFTSYLRGDRNPAIEEAFLAQCCYDYFVKDKLTEKVVFEDLQRLIEAGQDVQRVCKLAFAKYYAEHASEITEPVKKLLWDFLRELRESGSVLPCFHTYLNMFPFMSDYQDKTIIEYKTSPGTKAVIHYLIENHAVNGEEYQTKEMVDVFGGVCVASFVLFFGEKLMYYVTEEKDGKSELTESGNISRSEMRSESSKTRFGMLNDMMIAEALQDYDTVHQLLEEYTKLDYMVEHLFDFT